MTPTPTQITKAREAAGMTKTQFAKLMSVSLQSVYNWEHGIHPMKACCWKLARKSLKARARLIKQEQME